MVEGSLWVYGHTDLGDYYAGRLTLRQVMVRLMSLPPEAPTWDVIRAEHEQAERRREVSEVENVLAQYKPKEGRP